MEQHDVVERNMMELQELKVFVERYDNSEIRVVSHAGNRFYQLELEDVQGQRSIIGRSGKPVLFRSLDDVYMELKWAGIHQTHLVHYVANDEAAGR